MKKGINFLATIGLFLATYVYAQELSHYNFAYEYVSTLGAMERIREANEHESKQTENSLSIIATGIHYSTQIKLELQVQVAKFRQMQLEAHLKDVAESIIEILEEKIKTHDVLIVLLTKIMTAYNTGDDVGGLAAKLPRLRAIDDGIDKTIFSNVTPLVYYSLIDRVSDGKGAASFLVISKRERQKLLSCLSNHFGGKLEIANQNYIVSSASVFRKGLLARKCADER